MFFSTSLRIKCAYAWIDFGNIIKLKKVLVHTATSELCKNFSMRIYIIFDIWKKKI